MWGRAQWLQDCSERQNQEGGAERRLRLAPSGLGQPALLFAKCLLAVLSRDGATGLDQRAFRPALGLCRSDPARLAPVRLCTLRFIRLCVLAAVRLVLLSIAAIQDQGGIFTTGHVLLLLWARSGAEG